MTASASSAHLNHSARRCRSWVTSIRCPSTLNEKNVSFFICDRAMLHSLRHDIQLTWPESYVPVSQLDGNAPLQHEKKVIRVVVFVPNELALELYDPQVVAVELTDRSRLPILAECCELLGEIDALH